MSSVFPQPTSVTIAYMEMTEPSQAMPTRAEAPLTMPQPIVPVSPEVLVHTFGVVVGMLTKLMKRFTYDVYPLPTQQLDVVVEEWRPVSFWRRIFSKDKMALTYTTKSIAAWELCDSVIDAVLTAVYIDTATGTPYVWRDTEYVELEADRLLLLPIDELLELVDSVEWQHRLGSEQWHDGLRRRWALPAAH